MRGLAAVLFCLMLASCAGQQAPPQAPASSSPASDTSTPSIPAPLPPSSAPLTTTPTRAPQPGAMTVRGTVAGGVEAGCLTLNTGTAQYLLLGADPAIAVAGAEIEVTGRAEPGAMTTCQQGTPFRVEETVRINP
ncbi:hypothetical protein ABZ345_31570 [Lentzea sp. NPDC005914]|uniref:hypothetical protein n=1 Tax=Lentzea sp. NPDC005914 TaxID=3154572 RepID=UPI003401449F